MKRWPRFLSCTKWQLGKGDKIRFWQDRLAGKDRLQNLFPRIFEIAHSKGWAVADACRLCNGYVDWSVRVNRHLNDWEINEYEELLLTLEKQCIKEESNKILWNLEKRGNFSVQSYYSFLVGGEEDVSLDLPIKQIWKTNVPPRMTFFAWEACRERILTFDNLRTRGQVIVNRCSLCMCVEESSNHLLLWCPVAHSL